MWGETNRLSIDACLPSCATRVISCVERREQCSLVRVAYARAHKPTGVSVLCDVELSKELYG